MKIRIITTANLSYDIEVDSKNFKNEVKDINPSISINFYNGEENNKTKLIPEKPEPYNSSFSEQKSTAIIYQSSSYQQIETDIIKEDEEV